MCLPSGGFNGEFSITCKTPTKLIRNVSKGLRHAEVLEKGQFATILVYPTVCPAGQTHWLLLSTPKPGYYHQQLVLLGGVVWHHASVQKFIVCPLPNCQRIPWARKLSLAKQTLPKPWVKWFWGGMKELFWWTIFCSHMFNPKLSGRVKYFHPSLAKKAILIAPDFLRPRLPIFFWFAYFIPCNQRKAFVSGKFFPEKIPTDLT